MTWPAALLDPARTPDGLKGPASAPAGRRFDVYRNNVMSSLVQAMRDGFPVVRRLVGEAFFAAMATEFIRRHPPTSPLLFTYGAVFPAFVEGFSPASGLPYLADTARLELMLRRAYHAADTTPMAPEALGHPDIESARLTLSPAVTVLSSPYPIHAIWRANMDPSAPKPTGGAQSVLVTRADWDPLAEPVPAAEARFVTALATLTLGEATDDPDLDLATALTRLIARKAITSVEIPA
jgi:hypothetical protein